MRVPDDAGTQVRAWRTATGMTQQDLATALDVTLSTVSRWENQRSLPSKMAWRAIQKLVQRTAQEQDSHDDH